MTPEDFNELLKNEVLLIDGAMGTMIQELGYSARVYGGEDFQMLSEMLNFSRPEDVKNIHLHYYQAGASAVETNTLCASPLRLEEHDFTTIDDSEFPPLEDGRSIKTLSMSELSYNLSKRAVELACAAREEYKRSAEYDQRPLLVIASLGPSNWVLSSTQADLKRGDFDTIRENFYTQALGLIDGGADVLLFETQQDILELKCAILGVKQALRERNVDLPIMAQVTVDAHAKMQIFNTDIIAAFTTLRYLGIQTFGINCGLGPDLMLPAVKKLSRYCDLPVSIIPNAGLPESFEGRTIFRLTPEKMTAQMMEYVTDYGINIIGGCCGTRPEHIRHLRQALGMRKPVAREVERPLYISGPQQVVKLDSSESLIRIGERLNVRGSKKVREAVEHSDPINHEALEEVISEQTRDLGLEIIDVCMDSNIVDTKQALVEVIQNQTFDFNGAMCLDSFDVNALAEAIKVYPGRPIINSISLEEYAPGVDKVDAVLEVTREHGPVYIALATDITGPATTAEKKVELAAKIVEKAKKKHGVGADQLLIDINAFPIGSESDDTMNFSLESLKAIPDIKAIHPDLKVTIGVGNLTNGLAQKPYMRKVLTSVFLDEGRKRGLDAAIVNPNHYVPISSLPESDYELGLKVILERDLDAFAELEEIAIRKKGVTVTKKVVYDDLEPIPSVCAKIRDGYKQREPGSVEAGGKKYTFQDRIVLQVADIIAGTPPLELINDHLMPTMEELGSEFAAGTVSLPHLLKSADVMKQVMRFLEEVLKNTNGDDASEDATGSKGTIVLGTVYQDVHSIGKDLTKTLMENYGYRVIDLGVQVPVQDFVETARKNNAIAIGMSALLVQTSNHMISVSSLLEKENMKHIPILIGGAPVNRRHAAFVALAGREDESTMRNNVFYCRSGMDGVNILNQLSDTSQAEKLYEGNGKKLKSAFQSGQKQEKERANLLKTLPRRKVFFSETYRPDIELGMIRKIEVPVTEFKSHLNRKMLFSLNWKFGGEKNWEKKGITRDQLEQTLDEWIARSARNNWIQPQAVFAIFNCRGSRDKVTILSPENGGPLATLSFNDVIGKGNKDLFSVAEFFNPEQDDLIALQLSTAGPGVSKAIEAFKEDNKEGALMLQGLSDRIAEDMADVVNAQIDRLVYNSSGKSSQRYSPGYPAMTDISNNSTIADLLEACQRTGISLTRGYQFNPTGTTAAVVCFHQDAGYQ